MCTAMQKENVKCLCHHIPTGHTVRSNRGTGHRCHLFAGSDVAHDCLFESGELLPKKRHICQAQKESHYGPFSTAFTPPPHTRTHTDVHESNHTDEQRTRAETRQVPSSESNKIEQYSFNVETFARRVAVKSLLNTTRVLNRNSSDTSRKSERNGSGERDETREKGQQREIHLTSNFARDGF